MKKIIIPFLFCFVSYISFSQSKADSLALWNRVAELNGSVFGTKDSATIDKLLASKLNYGHSTGTIENRAEMLHNAVHNIEDYSNISVKNISADFAGGAAVVRYILRGSTTKDSVTSPLNLSILQVWIKENGDWKLLARQAVKINPL